MDVSRDGGATWAPATVEQDYGKYSFRRWNATVTLPAGTSTLAVRATGNDGGTQIAAPIWNPSGYLRTSIETYKVTAS